jgi:hypothetical protein
MIKCTRLILQSESILLNVGVIVDPVTRFIVRLFDYDKPEGAFLLPKRGGEAHGGLSWRPEDGSAEVQSVGSGAIPLVSDLSLNQLEHIRTRKVSHSRSLAAA